MKNKLIISGVLIFLSVAICVFEMMFISNISAQSIEILSVMKDKTKIKSKQQLSQLAGDLYDLWKNNNLLMAIFLQHSEIDQIEQSIAIIKTSIEQGDSSNFHEEVTRVGILIENLRDSEFPYVENVL